MTLRMPNAWSTPKATPLKADAGLPKWWVEMSEENKKEYVAEHPTSKYANLHNSGSEDKAPDHGSKQNEAPAADKGGSTMSPEDKKPNSPFRKKLGAFLKSKGAAIAGHLKNEAKEWKTAGGALAGLAKGKKLSDHEKAAIASVAVDLATITIGMITGHAVYEGAKEILTHVGKHVAEEALIKAAVHGAIHSASVIKATEDPNDQILQRAIQIMMDTIESGDLESASNDKPVTARIDMSADVAGKGKCPECKRPMEILTAGTGKVWACVHDRITLPIPDGYTA